MTIDGGEKKVKMQIECVPWTTPNFVSSKLQPCPRQDGFQEGPKWPLHEVDAEVLAQMCDEFRAEVFRKAGKADPAVLKEPSR